MNVPETRPALLTDDLAGNARVAANLELIAVAAFLLDDRYRGGRAG